MGRGTLFCVFLLGLFLTVGCNDPKEPNEKNFTDAINAVLVLRQAVIPTPGVPSVVEKQVTLIEDLAADQNADKTYSESDQNKFRRQLTYAKLLESTGLAEIEHGPFQNFNFRGEIENGYGYIIRYREKYAKDVKRFRDGKIGLIAGFVGVDKILKYTEPIERKGKLKCTVTYTRTIISRPDWATDTVIDYSGVKNYIKNSQSITLVLSEQGWEVEGYGGHHGLDFSDKRKK